jgi:hypothetical protein
MWHLPVGICGALVGAALFPAVYALVRFTITKEPGPYNLDPKGIHNAFEPFLSKYLRISEFVVGLAAGSIVLLVGSHDSSLLARYF